MKILWLAAAVTFVVLPSRASITGGALIGGQAQTAGGTFIQLPTPFTNPFGPPDSVGQDTFNDSNLYAFNEQQDVVLSQPLTVDGGTISAGTTISSYYVFYDPLDTQSILATVNFSGAILGIISSDATLADSDFLSNPAVNYLDVPNRGLEAGDFVTINGTNQILFNTSAISPGDYVRIITAIDTVPEPASIALMGGGLVALAALLKRRNAKKN